MMKNIFWIFVLIAPVSFGQGPVRVIFDTDIAPDYDDVGALAILHALADRGEAEILATISCNAFETTAPTLSVINTYFRRPDIPVGIIQSNAPNKACSQEWAQAIIKDYPHSIRSNRDARDALSLYRQILSGQPDGSVTIITVGFFSNLARLLQSGPDTYSPLAGPDLIKKKVKRLVSMAGRIEPGGQGGYEFNVQVDARASAIVFSSWPTEVILSGYEVGERILTGISLIHNESIQHSPVKDAFRLALARDHNSVGRNSWDETAVWVAVRGMEPWFGYRKMNFEILPDGKDVVVPGEKFTYLEIKADPKEIAKGLEELMMHQPEKK